MPAATINLPKFSKVFAKLLYAFLEKLWDCVAFFHLQKQLNQYKMFFHLDVNKFTKERIKSTVELLQ